MITMLAADGMHVALHKYVCKWMVEMHCAGAAFWRHETCIATMVERKQRAVALGLCVGRFGRRRGRLGGGTAICANVLSLTALAAPVESAQGVMLRAWTLQPRAAVSGNFCFSYRRTLDHHGLNFAPLSVPTRFRQLRSICGARMGGHHRAACRFTMRRTLGRENGR